MSSCLSFNDLNYEIWSKMVSSFPCLGSRSGDASDEKTTFVRIYFPFTNDIVKEAHFECIDSISVYQTCIEFSKVIGQIVQDVKFEEGAFLVFFAKNKRNSFTLEK